MYPRIQHLPLGRISRIKLIVYAEDMTTVILERLFNTLNPAALLEIVPTKITHNIIFVHCNDKGVVKKLEGDAGEYCFRQENKATITL